MQDVSCEPLMLCPSENPQASLDIFSQPHHHPTGFCIYRKAINKNKPLSSGIVLPRIGPRKHSGAWRALPWVTGGNALGLELYHKSSAWRAVRQRIGSHQCTPVVGARQKHQKNPCAWCKMSLTSHWCCARLKILKQAWIFSATHTITPQGSCIHRKAINKDKPSLSSGVLPLTLLNLGCTRKNMGEGIPKPKSVIR